MANLRAALVRRAEMLMGLTRAVVSPARRACSSGRHRVALSVLASTAIFSVGDDAQAGPDHMGAHRTIAPVRTQELLQIHQDDRPGATPGLLPRRSRSGH